MFATATSDTKTTKYGISWSTHSTLTDLPRAFLQGKCCIRVILQRGVATGFHIHRRCTSPPNIRVLDFAILHHTSWPMFGHASMVQPSPPLHPQLKAAVDRFGAAQSQQHDQIGQ